MKVGTFINKIIKNEDLANHLVDIHEADEVMDAVKAIFRYFIDEDTDYEIIVTVMDDGYNIDVETFCEGSYSTGINEKNVGVVLSLIKLLEGVNL